MVPTICPLSLRFLSSIYAELGTCCVSAVDGSLLESLCDIRREGRSLTQQ